MADHKCTAEGRFDRIEEALGKLAEQMEKVTELLIETRINRKTLDDHENRLRSLEKNSSRNEMMSKWVERLVWAFVALAIYFVRTNGG